MTITTLTPTPAPRLSIADTSTLVTLSIGAWEGVVYDRAISEGVERRLGSAEGTFRGRKSLLPANVDGSVAPSRRGGIARAAPLQALHTIAGEVRAHHYRRTVLWETEGTALLHAKAYADYFAFMRDARVRHEVALDTFLTQYPRLIDAARGKLGPLFDADLYPSADSLAERFTFTLKTSPVPSYAIRETLAAQLGDDLVRDLREEAAQRERAVANAAMRQVYERIKERIVTMRDTLADPTKIFRDSLIGNVADLLDDLPAFNYADDPALDALAGEVRSLLVPPDALRTMPGVRATAVETAKTITSKIDAMLEAF